MKCPRCHEHELKLQHSCVDDQSPCKRCGKSRVVVVVLHDAKGFLSECQPCLHCLNKTNGAK